MSRLLTRGWAHCALPSLLVPLLLAGCQPETNPTAKPASVYYGDTTPDISGLWRPDFRPPNAAWSVDGQPVPGRDARGQVMGMPYTPAWQAIYDARIESNQQGKPYGDPHYNCWPRGPVSAYMSGNATMAITQTPGRVQQVFQEDSQVHDIYTDGRALPAAADPASPDYEPRMMGYAVGHWEGDTLVAETRGIRRELTLGLQLPHSDVTVVTERFTRLDPQHLRILVTVTDAKALTRPITADLRYTLDATGDLEDQFCAENNVNATDRDGYVTTDVEYKRSTVWDLPAE